MEAVEIPKTTDDYSVQAARHKSLRRLLVKSVVSGSAVLGVVFVLLHLRFIKFFLTTGFEVVILIFCIDILPCHIVWLAWQEKWQ